MPRAPKYPWEEWTNGKLHEAQAHVDFTCTIPSFVALLHSKAKSMPTTAVTTSVQDTKVVFRFHTPLLPPKDSN